MNERTVEISKGLTGKWHIEFVEYYQGRRKTHAQIWRTDISTLPHLWIREWIDDSKTTNPNTAGASY